MLLSGTSLRVVSSSKTNCKCVYMCVYQKHIPYSKSAIVHKRVDLFVWGMLLLATSVCDVSFPETNYKCVFVCVPETNSIIDINHPAHGGSCSCLLLERIAATGSCLRKVCSCLHILSKQMHLSSITVSVCIRSANTSYLYSQQVLAFIQSANINIFYS